MVVDAKELEPGKKILEVGVGRKKLKNAKKPLRTKLEKSGFSFAPLKIKGVYLMDEAEVKPGSFIKFAEVMEVGEVVDVQGVTKGRGFAGGMKRHGFKGGPKTHGQSDRARAVGSIGAGTTPGRVLKGKKMPGHYGVETKTVKGLTILAFNETKKEILVAGPVPGHIKSVVRLKKTGNKKPVELLAESLERIGFVTKEASADQVMEKEAPTDKDQPATESVSDKAKKPNQVDETQETKAQSTPKEDK